MTEVLVVAAALYLLLKAMPVAAPPQQITTRAPAGSTAAGTAGGAFHLVLPGVGEYTNVPGAGFAISLDPRVFGAGPANEPQSQVRLEAPALSANYVPEAQIQEAIVLAPPRVIGDFPEAV